MGQPVLDKAELEKFVREEKLDWVQTYSGLVWQDPIHSVGPCLVRLSCHLGKESINPWRRQIKSLRIATPQDFIELEEE